MIQARRFAVSKCQTIVINQDQAQRFVLSGLTWFKTVCKSNTVHSKIFATDLCSRSFGKMKSSRNGEIILSFTDIGKSCHSRDFFTSQICFNAIHENKIFAKISEFTVIVDVFTGPMWCATSEIPTEISH